MLLCKKLLRFLSLSFFSFLFLAFFLFAHKSIVNGDVNSLLFENLNPDTLYEVSVTAIYPDESESDDLIGSERTCK